MGDFQAGTTGTYEGSGGLTETVLEQATQAKESGRRELRAQLDERSAQVGRQARSLADAVRRSAQALQSQGKDELGIERLMSGVADQLERAGGYLETARGEKMLRDAERFVRERPWVVTTAAAAAGLVASRVFKASSERRYEGSPNRTTSLPARSGVANTIGDHDDLESRASRSPQTAGMAH
jgi:ElaB/YqjD/DUF883 family membrane-anchored ribosome-binding protein